MAAQDQKEHADLLLELIQNRIHFMRVELNILLQILDSLKDERPVN